MPPVKASVRGQQAKPQLERIFSSRRCNFINEGLAGKGYLQGIDRPHPAQRHRSFRHHMFDRGVWKRVDKRSFFFHLRVDATFRRKSFLNVDGRHNDAMGKRNRPTSDIQPGSIGACAMKGNSYAACMRRPTAFETLPTEYSVAPFFEDDCFSESIVAAEVRSLLGPSSQVTLSRRRPSNAFQVLSATTATAE